MEKVPVLCLRRRDIRYARRGKEETLWRESKSFLSGSVTSENGEKFQSLRRDLYVQIMCQKVSEMQTYRWIGH